MSHYRAYGLHIHSEIDLPELIAAEPDSPVDVVIRRGRVDGPLPGRQPRVVRFDADAAYLAWPSSGRFRVVTVDGTSQVTVDPLGDNSQLVRFALLGPVLAAVLQLRGMPLLHGSAIAIGEEAIAFVGRKRAGKSTTAAAFVAAGCSMLNDDLLPLILESHRAALVPGFPALKLEPCARRELLPNLPLVGTPEAETQDKVLVSDRTVSPRNLALRAVIVLDPDASAQPASLMPHVALAALLEHGYALKFPAGALGNGQASKLFEACSRLSNELPVIRVGRTGEQGRLADLPYRLLDYCGMDSPRVPSDSPNLSAGQRQILLQRRAITRYT
jgi:hypothetical protein